MPAFRFLNVVIFSVLIGSSVLIYAQDEKSQENKPPQQEEPKDEPKPEAKPSTQEAAKPSKEEKKDQKQEQKQEQQQSHDQVRPEGQEHPPQSQAQRHAAQAGKPAGNGGHIPDDKFRAHFGRSHTFTAKTVIVQGQPQFQYGGYSFELVDAWPVGWAYTDECYIDYMDGEYFLFDLLHPGVRVAVIAIL